MRLTDAACFYAALDQFDRGISEDRADREVRHSLRIRRVPAEDLERLVQDVAMERARLRNSANLRNRQAAMDTAWTAAAAA